MGAWVRSIGHRGVRGTDERIAWLLVIGTIPGALTGVLLENVIEEHLGEPWLIAVMLATLGLVLLVVDRVARQERRIEDLRWRDALLIGAAQAVALQPGVSRAGVTITAARSLGMEREDAARFSFLLSLPIIGGAGIFKGVKLIGSGLPPGTEEPFIWGMLASAVTGFAVIAFVLAYVRRRSFAPFVLYRVLVAALVLGLIVANVRSATV